MARKIFISVLGTGFYEPCKYTKGSFVSSNTRFIQQATLEYLKVSTNWTTRNADDEVIDRVIILLTKGAKESNWRQSKRTNKITGQEEDYMGLEQVLQDMNLPCPVETIDIPDGRNEEEMWAIFNSVYETLRLNDELYFDLTHSYRYLPMLVLVLSNYAKFLKGVKVKHISYGNYEARDIASNEAPLMDILPLTMLQDWTFAAADLIQNGNIQRFMELKETDAIMPMLRAKGKKNITRKMVEEPLDNYIIQLDAFLRDMRLCQGPNILRGKTINNINACHEQIVSVFDDIIAPIPPIINEIKQSLEGFEPVEYQESLRNGYAAAKWCYEHQLYQQALTILEENINTEFCLILGTEINNFDQRSASGKYLRNKGYREEDWEKNFKEEKEQIHWEKIKEMVRNAVSPNLINFINNVSDDAGWIHRKRNAYNHASMTNGKMFSFEDVNKLGEKIERIIKVTR